MLLYDSINDTKKRLFQSDRQVMDDRKPLVSLGGITSSETVFKTKGPFDKPLKSLKLFFMFFKETAFFCFKYFINKKCYLCW